MKRLKWIVAAVALIAIILFLYQNVFLHAGFPYTHDGENHLARFANYKIALREGQLPPRWAPNLQNRYGYPVFNYNYPLSNILSVPFSLLGINYQTTFKLLALGFLLTGSLGIMAWLKNFSLKPYLKILGAILWLTSPYIASLLYFRGSIGELAAVSILPWVLWSVWKISNGLLDKRSTLAAIAIFTAFFLSHNVAAVFAIPIISIIALYLLKENRAKWLLMLRIVLISVALSSWFWIPALAEMGDTIISSASNQAEFSQHFPTLHQLLFSPIEFGFSSPGPVDSLVFSANWLLVLLLILSLALLAAKRKINAACVLAILALGLLVFQLEATSFIWQDLPFVRFIQFPWRLTLFFTVLVLPPALYAIKQIPKQLKYLVVLVVAIQVVQFSSLRAVDYFDRNTVDYEAFSQTTSTQNENMPKDFSFDNISEWQPSPSILEGDAETTVEEWSGSSRIYQVNAKTPSIIVEPTAFYPGWQTTISNGNGMRVDYVDNETIGGRIAYKLEPGEYSINTRFTQNTPARLIGNSITIIGIIYISWLLFSPILRKKDE